MNKNKTKVLIVEDDAVIAMALKNDLEERGYEPDICLKGVEAKDKAIKFKPDIILMDIRLEEKNGKEGEYINGLEVYENICREIPVPAIYITSYKNSELLERAIATGTYHYITKPVNYEDVDSAIKIALARHKLEQELRQRNQEMYGDLNDQVERNTILIVDGNASHSKRLKAKLEDKGFEVLSAGTLSEAREKIISSNIDVVILELMFETGDTKIFKPNEFELGAAKNGVHSGIVLAKWIKRYHRYINMIAYSHEEDEEDIGWFRSEGYSFFNKNYEPEALTNYVCWETGFAPAENLKCFIVHGHDIQAKYELMWYLLKKFKLDPIALNEELNMFGQAFIERIEKSVKDIDLVFVLLTPDDVARALKEPDIERRRARQNVIFEMGYFFGKLGRKHGKVILLCKGEIELPSDLGGLAYINISNGIKGALEEIRTQISAFLPGYMRRVNSKQP